MNSRTKRVSFFILASAVIIGGFQNCSKYAARDLQKTVSASASNSASTDPNAPTVSFVASSNTWVAGSNSTVSLQYSTTNATSVSGYQVFTGTCSMAQTQGGTHIDWTWPSSVDGGSWSTTLANYPAEGQRDDSGCSIRYCVVATNDKGSSEGCQTVQIIGQASSTSSPVVNFTISPLIWNFASGDTVNINYSVQNATAISGYHTFEGTCALASQFPNKQQVPWEFGNNLAGNSWTTQLNSIPQADERDDRGCTITYCLVATNATDTTRECRAVSIPLTTATNLPVIIFNMSPTVWRFGSGDTVNMNYTVQNASSTRGYHTFEGSCAMAQQYPNKQKVPWDFANQVAGNSWSTQLNGVPQPGDRDDRGCTITYCVVASNSTATLESCRAVSIQ